GVAGIAEYVNREMADCACDPCTIEIQACEIGSPNVFPSIHFHAGEDRKEIFFAKLKASCRFQQCTRHEVASLSVEEVVDFSAPCGQSRELLFDRPVSIGDVVDLPAERIDGVHAVTTIPRQQTHRPIERGASLLDPMPDGLAQRVFS